MNGSNLFSVKDSALSRLVRSDSFNKNMGNDLSCLKCEGERKETDPPLGKYSFFYNKLLVISSADITVMLHFSRRMELI